MSNHRITFVLIAVFALIVSTAIPGKAATPKGKDNATLARINADAVLNAVRNADEWGLYPHEGSQPAVKSSPFVEAEPQPIPPFPILLNQAVEKYVNAYLTQPAGLEDAFERSRPFLPQMRRIMERHGVPPDFVYLSFAESLFTKQGQGPWQFTKATARRFGLHVNYWVDERRDPIMSTRVAAEYLSRLHVEADDDWRVAVVGWNLGPGRLDRYSGLEGSSNYRKLVSSLPAPTRNLLRRFMAVAFIAHNAVAYGIRTVNFSAPPTYEVRRFRGGVSLYKIARDYHTAVWKLRSLNPGILRNKVPPYAHAYPVLVPVQKHHEDVASSAQ